MNNFDSAEGGGVCLLGEDVVDMDIVIYLYVSVSLFIMAMGCLYVQPNKCVVNLTDDTLPTILNTYIFKHCSTSINVSTRRLLIIGDTPIEICEFLDQYNLTNVCIYMLISGSNLTWVDAMKWLHSGEEVYEGDVFV